jgi:hypothetical protein
VAGKIGFHQDLGLDLRPLGRQAGLDSQGGGELDQAAEIVASAQLEGFSQRP